MARRDLSQTRGSALPQHPTYALWEPEWRKLLDVYEGAGGFLSTAKPYIAAHPREWLDHTVKVEEEGSVKWTVNPNPRLASPKLTARRNLARYENVAATLLDQVRAALFRKPADRTFADPDTIDDSNPLKVFWDDVDGLGRPMSAYIQEAWTVAGVFGHAVLYAERDGETGDSPSQADQPPVMLRGYTPLDVPDWLIDDRGRLVGVRLLEAMPRESFEDFSANLDYQVRTVDETKWTLDRVTKARRIKEQIDEGDHGFGTLPVVMLYARRRVLTPFIGRSMLGDPQLYIDHYNLISEVRELLRNQTFAILNIPIGERTGGLTAEQELVGQSAGTQNVLFSTNPAGYISPQGENVTVYHEHIDRLLRTIYRLAVVGWESDSKDVESADSRKLKKEDLHQMLAGYAEECQDAEMQIARLVYRAQYGESWETQWDKDKPSVAYPDEFDVTALSELIEDTTAALALELGDTATRELKKRVATKMLAGVAEPILDKVEDEISTMEIKTEQEKQLEIMETRFQQMPGEDAA